MIPKDGLNLQYFLAVFRRRLWYVVLPFFIIIMGAAVYCMWAPKTYRSSTLILIQPQEVPTDYVRPLVTTDARSRLNILREQVMSRPRLEELVNKYDLYPEVRKSATMYDAVQMMRQHIEVRVRAKGRGREPGSFEVSYVGGDPVKVRDVTTAIANLFIDYNLKLRESQTSGTTQFLERELAKTREQLRQKEERVRQFKIKYMGMLPEQMENNYRMLAQSQQQLDSLNDTLQQIEDRKVLLQTQLGRLETLQGGPVSSETLGNGSGDRQTAVSLYELRRELKNLRSRYTDRHPDVIRLTTMIARLEGEPKGEAISVSPGDPSEARQLMLVQREDVLTQLKLIDKEIQKLNEDKRELTGQIQKYRRRLENAPKLEQMYVDLRRDYEQVNRTYQSLLQKKLQAEMAENLERTQKGEQFRILEPAHLPEKPFKPDVRKVLSMGLLLALACGFGLAFVREYFDQTFWERNELESALGLPVLVSVPVIQTGKERSWNMFKKAATVCILVSMASVLCYALLVLWGKGPAFLL